MGDKNAVFYANMCYVCHLTVREAKLKLCSSCKMVPYCSEQHQRKHWKKHKKLCAIIQKVIEILKPEELNIKKNWFKYRTNMMMLCELMMERKLCQNEINMILFPNCCQLCHAKNNLEACQKCLCISYCSEDHRVTDAAHHEAVCDSFALCIKMDLYLEKRELYPSFRFSKDGMRLTDNMKTFITSNIEMETRKADTKDIEQALVSELITCPLSLLGAVSMIDYKLPECAVIHVVGSGVLETASLKSWEMILHLYNHIKTVVICFIGPEIDRNTDVELCSSCKSKLIFQFSDALYHDFIHTEEYQQPDIICSFNCGFHEFEGSESDTWTKSLSHLIQNKNVPLIMTSFNEDEADKDLRMLLAVNQQLNVQKRANPFSSLRPFRDLENLGIYFNNGFITTVLQDI